MNIQGNIFIHCLERFHPTADAPLNEVYPADRQWIRTTGRKSDWYEENPGSWLWIQQLWSESPLTRFKLSWQDVNQSDRMTIMLTGFQLCWQDGNQVTGCQLSWQDGNQVTGCQLSWQDMNQADRMWIKLKGCQLSWKNMINLTGCQLSWQDVNTVLLTGCESIWQDDNYTDRMWIKLIGIVSSWPKVNLAAVWSEYSWLDAHLAYRKKIQLTLERRIHLQITESSLSVLNPSDQMTENGSSWPPARKESGRAKVSPANRTQIQLTGSGQYGKVFSWKQFEES